MSEQEVTEAIDMNDRTEDSAPQNMNISPVQTQIKCLARSALDMNTEVLPFLKRPA